MEKVKKINLFVLVILTVSLFLSTEVGALNIELHFDPLGTVPPEMQAAMEQAVIAWEMVLSDPVTVPLSIYCGLPPDGNPAAWTQITFYFGGIAYDDVRSVLIADAENYESGLVNQLPTYAEFDAYYEPGWSKDNVAVLSMPQATARALDYTFTPVLDDAAITFNSTLDWDYDPCDGITPGHHDFFAVAQHEIGHALGFCSVVTHIDTGKVHGVPTTPTPLDLYRLKAGDIGFGGYTFTIAPRVIATGQTVQDQVLFDGDRELGMCNGEIHGSGPGAGFSPDHYLADSWLPEYEYLGIMVPVPVPRHQKITMNDLRVLGLIGWDVAAWSDDMVGHWRGIGTGRPGERWEDPANWTPSAVPSLGYDLRVSLTEPGWVWVDDYHAYCRNLTLNHTMESDEAGVHIEGRGGTAAQLLAENIYIAESSYYGCILLCDGTVKVSNDVYVGAAGVGTITQSGGQFLSRHEYIGYEGVGTFTQTGGENTVAPGIGYIYLGFESGSEGSYDLDGDSSTSAFRERIGFRGNGTFTQSGGTNNVTDNLNIAVYPGTTGTYNLVDGELSVQDESVGVDAQPSGH